MPHDAPQSRSHYPLSSMISSQEDEQNLIAQAEVMSPVLSTLTQFYQGVTKALMARSMPHPFYSGSVGLGGVQGCSLVSLVLPV